MNLTDFNDLTKLLIALGGLATMAAGFWRWVLPQIVEDRAGRRAVRDVIVGREPIYDSTVPGKLLVPALQGIGVRMDTIESAVALLATNDRRLTDLEHRVSVVEAQAVERVITRMESTAAWGAVEAVAKSTPPDEDDSPLPSMGEN
jgi:hypothetical protein